MTVRVDVSPDLLMWAVERARWDSATIARRAPQFSKWVAGTRKPTLKQIQQFARDTHASLGLLFLSEPPAEELPIPDMRTKTSQKLQRPSADLIDTIYQCQRRQDWYRDYALEYGLVEPNFIGTATITTSESQIAETIRQQLSFDLADRPAFSTRHEVLRYLIDSIEDLGVLVMVNGVVGSNTHRRLDPDEFRGFALADRIAPVIFVNGADTKSAQVFTLIHELAHLWLGTSALSDATIDAREGRAEELWCNRVAAEVLVPLQQLQQDYAGEPTTGELDRLARKYHVSTLVVLTRIYDADLLNWANYRERYQAEHDRVMALVSETKTATGGNFYYTQPRRLSRRFTRALLASTLSGETSYRDAYQLLGTKSHSTFEGLADELGVR